MKDYGGHGPQVSCMQRAGLESSQGQLAGDVLRCLRWISGSEKGACTGTAKHWHEHLVAVNNEHIFPPMSSQSTWVLYCTVQYKGKAAYLTPSVAITSLRCYKRTHVYVSFTDASLLPSQSTGSLARPSLQTLDIRYMSPRRSTPSRRRQPVRSDTRYPAP
jgi:hypothetical protein